MTWLDTAMPPVYPHVEAALAAPDFQRVVHPTYRFLRENAPVYWSETLGRWIVTSHRHAEEVFLHPDEFSSFGAEPEFIRRLPASVLDGLEVLPTHFLEPGLIHSGGDAHTRLRRAVSGPFTPRAVQERRAPIEAQVARLLDTRIGDRGSFDLIDSLAFPLPVVVIAGVLGIPDSDLDRFPAWSAHLSRFFSTPDPVPAYGRDLDAVLVEWRAFVGDLLDDRMSQPRDDLLSTVAAAIGEGRISREEAVVILVHLLQAGHETTRNLVGNMVFSLLSHPDALAVVRSDPERINDAMEETLRLEPPADNATRVSVADRRLANRWIREGQTVIVSVSAANRDPERFERPDDFDLDRGLTSGSHLSFGRGIHACLGAALARLEAPIAVRMFLERYPAARLRSPEPAWNEARTMHGLRELWIDL